MRSLLPLAIVLAAAAPAVAATYKVEAAKSSMSIFVDKTGSLKMFGHTHRVLATEVTGEVEARPKELGEATVTLTYPAAGLKVDPKVEPPKDLAEVQRTMEEEVLEVKKHPEIRFRSTRVAKAEAPEGAQTRPAKAKKGAAPPPPRLENATRLDVTGDLTLHGVTKQVTIPLDVAIDDEALHAVGQVVVKQTDFGMTPPSAAGGKVRATDELVLTFEVVAHAGK